jgi:hypothetical protein
MSTDLLKNAGNCLLLKIAKGSIVLFLLMILCNCCYGQISFYVQSKLKTADGKPLAYDIFLKLAGDGTASARISFKDPVTGKKRLIQQNYIDNDFPDDSYNDSVTYLMPFGDAFNENDLPEKNFVTPKFEFYKKKGDGNIGDATPKVLYSYNKQQWFPPVSGSFEIKTFIDNSSQKAFFIKFYRPNESFYKNYFNVYTPLLTAAESRRKIFLLAVAATDDPKIGATTQVDLQSWETLFTYLLGKPNFQYTKITGKDFTKKAVDDAIDKLKPGPGDVVLFYYSGHGFRYTGDVSEFPRMALVANGDQSPDNANLSLEDVYNRIRKKGPRETIVLAECCNENYGAAPPAGKVRPYAEGTSAAIPRLNLDNFRALFLSGRKLDVLACAAEKNQLAAGNWHLGGFFTDSVIGELNKSLYIGAGDGESSWARILNNAKEHTRRQALSAPCNGGPACDGDRSLQLSDFKVNAVK